MTRDAGRRAPPVLSWEGRTDGDGRGGGRGVRVRRQIMVLPVTVGAARSPEGMTAADWAAREAVLRAAPLRFLRARRRPGAGSHPPEPDHSWLSAKVSELSTRHPQLEIIVEEVADDPAKALAASTEKSQLVVIGSRPAHAVTTRLTGSLALGLVAHARGPVVVVPEGSAHGADTERPVVAGLDLRTVPDPVLAHALQAARREHHPLRAVHVWSLQGVYSYPSALPNPKVGADAKSAASPALRAALAAAGAGEAEVPVEGVLRSGAVGPQLLHSAAGAGLLVVGHRARRHLPLGSRIGPVTHAALQHAVAPVAVVPCE
ncbi:hypothetical protein SLNWT_0216 [Streptomyces albus]|uniref:UspA domain-containing protein n=1 Tax=Streptomyces albus (strain ATCC 21838 / DSM 41398 / FERM P-419 / JCM 4703 / NBRC 107858) TaxID=1081613 RepID=A0A0B5ER13_STRA4|nr:hypothetical protein SLNWT_0216 [Streptomyces albus]AOU74906.1 hypothetical protein SLNHY_0215 [Streptomyces albus]